MEKKGLVSGTAAPLNVNTARNAKPGLFGSGAKSCPHIFNRIASPCGSVPYRYAVSVGAAQVNRTSIRNRRFGCHRNAEYKKIVYKK
jgi:hypothetical protein